MGILNNLKRSQQILNIYNKYRKFSSGLNLWNEELTPSLKHKIEDFWSSKINQKTEDGQNKEKYYVLSMFPYPSGNLHMGHVRVYTISDAIARFQRMNGKQVIHPIGWDAFGLPAENAAIERRIEPEEWTRSNIIHMKEQLLQLGCSFDWEREIATCDPSYYTWTQDIFLKLFEAGLAYQREAFVNWDPIDKTVLADEQVDENGCSWRSGAKVERKLLKQWFIRTTKFAKQLFDGLNDEVLHDWKDVIKIQKHWIGECNGVAFDFSVNDTKNFLTVWTETPEHIEQAKFVAINKENVLATNSSTFISETTKKLDLTLRNPLNGDNLPVYLTEEIQFLPSSDTHLGIPCTSEEDANFALKHKIPYQETSLLSHTEKLAKQSEMCERALKLNAGGYWTSSKLKDWLISRQRYWGTPIPIIHCDSCGSQPVPSVDLPVNLPRLKRTSEKGKSLLADCSEWVNAVCPKCGGCGRRETDTMDTFVDSSWYYLRYLDSKNEKTMCDVEKSKELMPVDLYIGGKEHAALHLYYARFVSHFLHLLGFLPEREPFKRLLVQGMVMGRSFRLKGTGQYLPADKVNIVDLKKNKAMDVETGKPVVVTWEKMSKSKHNGVEPLEMFKKYSVDTIRLLILADVAPTSHRNWNESTFPGVLNWQKRLWLTIQNFLQHRQNPPELKIDPKFQENDDYMFDSRNYYIKGATFNYCTSQQISVAVSKLQGLTNSLRRMPPNVVAHSKQFERALACQIIMLAPLAPHFASELWSGFVSAPKRLNDSGEIFWDRTVLEQQWPKLDENYCLDLVCQVNSEECAVIKMRKNEIELLTKEEALKLALERKEIQEALSCRNILDVNYNFYEGYEGVIKIVARKETVQIKDSN